MKAYIDFNYTRDTEYLIISTKALVCKYIDFECLYVSREFEESLPAGSMIIETGIFVKKFVKFTDYMQCVGDIMLKGLGFVIPKNKYSELYSEYAGMFNIPDNKDIPMYFEPKPYFNEYSTTGDFNNTLTVNVRYWNLSYNTVAYPVPANREDRETPEYYAREMLSNMVGEKYDSARAFTNAVDKIRDDQRNVVTPHDLIRDYCKRVVMSAEASGYVLCVYVIQYLDSTMDKCYARNADELIAGINKRKFSQLFHIVVQATCSTPLKLNQNYVVEFKDGKQFGYTYKGFEQFNKIFSKYINMGKKFNIR